MNKKLLLLSNSTNQGEAYLKWPENHIKKFLGERIRKVLFIPFAGVTIGYEEYTSLVSDAMHRLGYQVDGIHTKTISEALIPQYDAIMIGGGNSFQLANLLQQHQLLTPIRQAVEKGMPYIGWSAGSNMACPTLMTTNDMPVVQPSSFDTLNLVSFQINPHYTSATIPNHGGESRDMRIMEFLELNRNVKVLGLPEGCLIQQDQSGLFFLGNKEGKVFQYGKETKILRNGDDLSFLQK